MRDDDPEKRQQRRTQSYTLPSVQTQRDSATARVARKEQESAFVPKSGQAGYRGQSGWGIGKWNGYTDSNQGGGKKIFGDLGSRKFADRWAATTAEKVWQDQRYSSLQSNGEKSGGAQQYGGMDNRRYLPQMANEGKEKEGLWSQIKTLLGVGDGGFTDDAISFTKAVLRQDDASKEKRAQAHQAQFDQGAREMTWWDLRNSIDKGYKNAQLGYEGYAQMQGAENDQEILALHTELNSDKYHYSSENQLLQNIDFALTQLGQYANMADDSNVLLSSTAGGTIGAAGGAAFAGVGAIPGVIGGAITGARIGIAGEASQLEAGNTYLEMVAEGVPPEEAAKLALLIGVVNGALEASQVRSVGGAYGGMAKTGAGDLVKYFTKSVADQAGSKVAKETFRPVIADVVKEAGQKAGECFWDISKEAMQEVAQEAVTAGGVNLAKKQAGLPTDSLIDVSQRLESVLDDSIGGFGLIKAPAFLGGLLPGRMGVSGKTEGVQSGGVVSNQMETNTAAVGAAASPVSTETQRVDGQAAPVFAALGLVDGLATPVFTKSG